jgi:hypothetical protein
MRSTRTRLPTVTVILSDAERVEDEVSIIVAGVVVLVQGDNRGRGRLWHKDGALP